MADVERAPLIPRRATAVARGWIADFQSFIAKGDFFDLATGVIIGGAVGSVVSSIVNDILSPIISIFVGGATLENAYIFLRGPDPELCAKEPGVCDHLTTPALAAQYGAITLNYGRTLQFLINFFMVALILFVLVRIYTNAKDRFKKKEAEAAATAPPPPSSKECKFCLQDIPKAATKCMYCTSNVTGL
ncbi:large-conductance mechanosensitive channel [Zopfochytrium polystomum]|nr:large-conductance mechanosensitive channel [Zopfochytrium polystomum]